MDNNDWRPNVGQGSKPHVETGGDWRTQLTPDSREKVVNKIMEFLKRHFPFSGQDGLQELREIAMHFEEKNYTAAASLNDYSRKISLKLLSMESKSQNKFPNSLTSNSSGNNDTPICNYRGKVEYTRPPLTPFVRQPLGNWHRNSDAYAGWNALSIMDFICTCFILLLFGMPLFIASLDSTAQTGHSSGGDWQDEVDQKIKAMKEMYLPELHEMYQKIALKLQQYDSLPQPPKLEQLHQLKMVKNMLERMISLLQVPKYSIIPGLKEKLGLYEKHITSFVNAFNSRKPIPPPQQGHHGQPGQSQVQSLENQLNAQTATKSDGSKTALTKLIRGQPMH